jgi:WD40 repeat protein
MADEHGSTSEREQQVNRVIGEYLEAQRLGQAPCREELLARHPEVAAELASFLADKEQFDRLAEPLRPAPAAGQQKLDTGVAEAPTLAPPGPSHADPKLGTVRNFGDYELLEEIARGGMGVVYKARQITLNRPVALKMILAGQLASAADIQRFRIEAEAAGNLDHPHIVPIYEVGEREGQQYFSMKLVEGGNLTQHLPRYHSDQWAAAQLLVTVARAVHYAHQRGILHRDLKPGNILLDGQGQPHVTDFGLAKRVEGDSNLTQSGAIVGTPSYMPPEQASGKKGVLSTASDVYALGAVLYELLTGRPPFRAETALDTLLQVLEQDPAPVRTLNSKIDRDLETICLKCLQKEPEQRYGSAEALGQDLDRWCAGEPITARPVGRVERSWRWCRRNPALAALLGAVVVALMAGTGVSTYFAHEASGEARIARGNAEKARNESLRAKRESERARQSEFTVRRNLYVSQMSQAWLSWQAGQVSRVRELLDAQEPQRTGGHDFRRFEWRYLRRLLHSEWRTLREPGRSEGRALAFRPGRSQVAWDASGQVVLADTATGRVVRRFPAMSVIIFSPNDKYLAGVTSDKKGTRSVGVWDADTGNQLAALAGGHVCTFSPDGKRLAVGVLMKDKPKERKTPLPAVRIWEWAADKKVATLPFEEASIQINGIVFSPDGKYLAASGVPAGKVWEVATKKEWWVIRDPVGVKGVEFSPDGRFLATLGLIDVAWREPVKVWELATKKELWVLRQLPVIGLAFSPDGKRLATVGAGAQVWDAGTGKELLQLHGHGSLVSAVAFSRGGKRLWTGSGDQTVRVWDAASGKLLRVYRGHNAEVVSLALSPDNKWLATIALDNSIKLWDATQDPEARSFPVPLTEGFEGGIALAFKPGSNQLAVGADRLRIWDLARWRQARDFVFTPADRRVAYSADGRRLISIGVPGSSNGWVTVRDVGKPKPRMFVIKGSVDLGSGRMSEVSSAYWSEIAVSPDGRRLAHPRIDDKGVDLLDLDTGKRLSTLEVGKARVHALVFAPDSKRLAVAISNPRNTGAWRVRVKELASGKTAATLPVVKEDVFDSLTLVFSPDGQQVLAVGGKRVYVWDTASGKVVNNFALNTAAVKAAFSPDGKRLATGGGDGLVTLWDVTTGQQLLALSGFSDLIMALAFSPDGTRLAGGGEDGGRGLVKVWDARPRSR